MARWEIQNDSEMIQCILDSRFSSTQIPKNNPRNLEPIDYSENVVPISIASKIGPDTLYQIVSKTPRSRMGTLVGYGAEPNEENFDGFCQENAMLLPQVEAG